MKKIIGSLATIAVILGGSWAYMTAQAAETPTSPSTVQVDTDIQSDTEQSAPDSFPEPVLQPELSSHILEGPDGIIREFKVNVDYAKDGSYQRSQFGKAWADTDRNGCDTRNDVLSRDLHNITVNSKCQVMTGVLESDIYTGETIDFVRGEGACDKTGWNGAPVVYNGQPGGCSTAVTIDHVISLEEAWYLGAHTWNFEKRVAFANDTDNLVSTGANSWKNSKTPAEVVADTNSPMTAAGLCNYISKYINVVDKYGFAVSPEVAMTLSEKYTECGI